MARTTGERNLTELEGAVLGIIQERRRCTAYSVRKEILDSPTPYWSGSAGAIYPLMERLLRCRLVEYRAGAVGRRASRLYSLTRAGRAALRAWLLDSTHDLVTGSPPDPLRTRLTCLGVLSPRERRAFLDEAARRMKAHERSTKQYLARAKGGGNLYVELATRGAQAALRARMRWLEEVIRTLRAGRVRRTSR